MRPQKSLSLETAFLAALRSQRRNIFLRRACVILIVFCLFQCTEDEIIKPDNDGTTGRALSNCGCTYNVPAGKHKIDGLALGIKPGAVICLQAGTPYKNLLFINIKGTHD